MFLAILALLYPLMTFGTFPRKYCCVRRSRSYRRVDMHLSQLSVNPPSERMEIFAIISIQGFPTLCSPLGRSILTEPLRRVPHPSLSRSRALALRQLLWLHLNRLYGGPATNLHGCTGHPRRTCTNTHLSARIPLLLLHSFPGVDVRVATEGPKFKTE